MKTADVVPEGSDFSDVPPPPTARQHALGLGLVMLVAVIWVASSELIQYIFGESSFSKPYFLSYFCTSLFSVYLLGFSCNPSWRALIYAPSILTHPGQEAGGHAYTELARLSHAHADAEDDAASGALDTEDVGSTRERGVGINRHGISESEQSRDVPYSVPDLARVVSVLGPLFYSSQFLYNLGLRGTSVASSSTISTVSTLFTLIIGAASGVERFSLTKLISAVLTIAGVAAISANDWEKGGRDNLVGDAVSLVSAALYALYTVTLKKKIPTEERASMAMMLGMVGALVAVTGWPFLIIAHVLKWEIFEIPDPQVFALLLTNALIGSVLSDYLSARSVALTTPVIATLALSLTLPMSVLVDYWLRGLRFNMFYLSGVALVLVGFVAANVDEALARRDRNQAQSSDTLVS